jgi:hypothetical protein
MMSWKTYRQNDQDLPTQTGCTQAAHRQGEAALGRLRPGRAYRPRPPLPNRATLVDTPASKTFAGRALPAAGARPVVGRRPLATADRACMAPFGRQCDAQRSDGLLTRPERRASQGQRESLLTRTKCPGAGEAPASRNHERASAPFAADVRLLGTCGTGSGCVRRSPAGRAHRAGGRDFAWPYPLRRHWRRRYNSGKRYAGQRQRDGQGATVRGVTSGSAGDCAAVRTLRGERQSEVPGGGGDGCSPCRRQGALLFAVFCELHVKGCAP